MAITSEEFVVKVKADLTAYKKEMEAMKKKYSTMESEVKGIKQKYKEEEKIQKMKEKYESKQNKDRNTSFKELFKTVVKLGIITESFKQIGKVIQEGRENLYWYSKLNNGLYAELADKRTSAIQAFGNAIAAFESMFFNGISPYIEKVFKWLTEFMNRLSRVIANIFDLPTYLQARDDILVEWSKNIKETRMLISGFDKLNIFNGTKNTMPENMFYEVERDANDSTFTALEDLWNWLKQSWNAFWTWIKPVFNNFWENLKSTFAEIWAWFTEDQYSEYIQRWADGTESTEYHLERESPLTTIRNWFTEQVQKLERWVNTTMIPALQTAWEGLKDWIEKKWPDIKAWIMGTLLPTLWKGLKIAIFGSQEQMDEFLGTTGYLINGLKPGNWASTNFGDRPADGNIYDTTNPYNEMSQWRQWGLGFIEDIIKNYELIRKGRNIFNNADGGVYTKPTLGLVGEYSNAMSNPELITPQSLLDERLQLNNKDLLSAFNQMSNNIIGAIQGMNMEVRIGDDVIARSASRGQEAYYRQMGRPLIR